MMSDQNITMFAAVLRLTRSDLKALKITDAYSLHRVVYDLFEDVRSDSQKQASVASGILYADKGGDFHSRQILMLADRPPNPTPAFGQVAIKPIPDNFLHHDRYAFEVVVNPTKRDKQTVKTVAVRGREAVTAWFIERAVKSWGFSVNPDSLQIQNLAVQSFKKDGQTVTHGSATFKGELQVADREQFSHSFRQGIGRGRAFGFGLLQIVPL